MASENDQFGLNGDMGAGAEGQDAVRETPSVWRTGLLLATSAVLGGIAVVLWNRRSLERMREESEFEAADPRPSPANEEYID
jgi:hypothetical protein